MRIRIRIKTPPGNATSMSKKLGPFVFGIFKKRKETFKTNVDDSILIWEIECDSRRAEDINKRVVAFEYLVENIFKKKIVQKTIKKYCNPGDDLIVKEMLKNQTSIRIMKQEEEDGI